MSCDKNKSFQVANLFNELQTDGEKRIARLNLGVKDSDSLTWGNIGGNIYDQEDLVYFVEMLKMLASQTGTVAIFRLNNNEINRSTQDIPYGWQDSIPDTTPQDELWMSQAVKQGGIYKVDPNGIVWSVPIKINYSNVVDDAQQLEIDELRSRLNASIQNQQYIDNLINSMNQVTVNEDGSISVVGRDGQTSVWQHQDLGNYLLLGNIYGTPEQNETSYFVINKTGLLQAHNAVVHGTIYATDGWFAGQLRAATGSFTGEITATSGRIGGWQIVDGVLKPENVPTTALIGKIQASQVEFGSTLTDLRTLIAEDYNSKINTLRTNIQSNIDLISTRFQLSNDSISSSVQEIREIQNNHGQQLRTVSDKINQEKNARMTQYQLLESKIQQNSDQLSLGVQEAILSYSNKFKDYITTEQLESKLTLLSNQIAAKVSEVDYNENNRVIESRFAELAVTPEQIQSIVSEQITGVTSNWTQTADSLQAQITEKGNLLSQLGITSDGIMMKGNTLAYYATGNVTDPIFACNSDGSGKIAKGTISWDTNGNVTLGRNVVISWNDIQDKPEIDPDGTIELSIKDIQPVYQKNTSLPSKPISTTIISNEDVDQQWTTKVPTLDDNTKSIYKCDKITHSNDTITFTTVKEDTALTIAQRSKKRLDYLFQSGDTQGTIITNEYIYTGAFGTRDAYIMHIASDTSNPKWELKTDGSGFLSSGAISWDANGIANFDQNVHIGSWRLGQTEFYTGDLYNNSIFPQRSLNPETYYSLQLDKQGIQLFNYKQNVNEVTGSMFMLEQTGMFSRTIHSVNAYNPGSPISWSGSTKIFNIDFSTGYAVFCNGNITLEDDKITLTNELEDRLIISANELTFYNSIEDTEQTISWEELFNKLNSIN